PGRFPTLLAAVLAALAFAAPAGAQGEAPPAAAAEASEEPLFAILLEPGPAWLPGRPFAEQGLLEHFQYWVALFGEGRVATFGPLGDDSGLILLRAAGQAEADAVVAADPGVVSGTFTGTARPYALRRLDADVLESAGD